MSFLPLPLPNPWWDLWPLHCPTVSAVLLLLLRLLVCGRGIWREWWPLQCLVCRRGILREWWPLLRRLGGLLLPLH